MFRTKGIKIMMVASMLTIGLGSTAAYAMSGDQNNVSKLFATLTGRDAKATNSTLNISKIMFDKNGNVVDVNGKIVMTAEKFKSNQSGAVIASEGIETVLTQDKDGNYVDESGKVIITTQKQKENQAMIDEEMKSSNQEDVANSSSKIMFDKNGNVVDVNGKIVMTAEKFNSNQSGTVMASTQEQKER